ncbi:MAG: RNase adapter RapZ, partial [Clostridia bacterium]|nr:RNase adapter RapZ [Clostridia bacterium]
GTPRDADLIFDARCFPNPFYIPQLKNLTGLDKPVSEYVLSCEGTKEFIKHFLPLIDCLLPMYKEEGKNELIVAIGCTGGKHRSVTIAELLCKHINDKGYPAYIFHRDINNDGKR